MSDGRCDCIMVRMSHSCSRGRGFDFQLGHYQVVTTWMVDCLRTGKPSGYITNSVFHPSGEIL